MRIPYAQTIATALLVSIVGGLAGWYVYIRTHTNAIQSSDKARGFSVGGVFGNNSGGATQNILDGAPGITVGSNPIGVTGNGAIGSTTNPLSTGDTVGTTSPARERVPETPRLWQAVKTPIAGFGFVQTESGISLRYVERATGYVFSADPWTGSVERLSNTLMPKTHEAFFAGDVVIERRIDNGALVTFSGSIARSATSTTLHGAPLEKNIQSLSLNPFTRTVFFLRPTPSGTEGVVAQADGSKQSVVFTSTLRGWKPIDVQGRRVVVQRPSDGVIGAAYEIEKSGGLTPIVEPAAGLMVLPRASSTSLLWSTAIEGRLSVFAKTAGQNPVSFALSTVADKCAWAPIHSGAHTAYCAVPRTSASSEFLQAWYQGALHTEDTWWLLDTSSGASQALYASEEAVDVRDPQVDPSGKWIAFTDGKDESLWVLRIVK